MHTHTVHLFAAARDLSGSPTVVVHLPATATVVDLRRTLMEVHPALAPLLPRCRIAVNQEFADESTVLPPGAELAVIPPVSGG
jgi:molybdopterin synthase catalytic subunit